MQRVHIPKVGNHCYRGNNDSIIEEQKNNSENTNKTKLNVASCITIKLEKVKENEMF